MISVIAIAGLASRVAEAGNVMSCDGEWVTLDGDPEMQVATISFPPGSVPDVDLQLSIAMWNAIKGMGIEFAPVASSITTAELGNGVNEVGFTTIPALGSTGQAIDGCDLVEFDMVFNSNLSMHSFGAPDPSTPETGTPTSFRVTAIHELGHAMGLEHYANAMSLMFPAAPEVSTWYAGATSTRVHPHPDDVYTARVINPTQATHVDVAVSNFEFVGVAVTDLAMPNGVQVVAPGGVLEVRTSIGNLGNGSASFAVHIYISSDGSISTSDVLVDSFLVTLSEGTFATLARDVEIPSLTPGNYDLGVILDPADNLAEEIEGNNVATLPTTLDVIEPVSCNGGDGDGGCATVSSSTPIALLAVVLASLLRSRSYAISRNGVVRLACLLRL